MSIVKIKLGATSAKVLISLDLLVRSLLAGYKHLAYGEVKQTIEGCTKHSKVYALNKNYGDLIYSREDAAWYLLVSS